MSKVPYVERDYVGGGLKGECAYLWALFLANEADMSGDVVAYDRYKALVDELAPKPGKAVPSSVHFAALEEAIEKYDRNH
jgi:hypothetical protein